MPERSPVFELHILPMFRQIDRLHMLRVNANLDLLDYDSVKASADMIISFATGAHPLMPPAASGGPWPSEWMALFTRWKAGGFRRLAVGTGQNFKLAIGAGNTHQLSCVVAVPNAPDAKAWFDVVDPGPATATYRVVIFQGEANPPPVATNNINISERVDPAAAANGVTVIDSAGPHQVTEAVA